VTSEQSKSEQSTRFSAVEDLDVKVTWDYDVHTERDLSGPAIK